MEKVCMIKQWKVISLNFGILALPQLNHRFQRQLLILGSKIPCISKEEEGVIYISVPNEFVREWLMTKFHKLILKDYCR